MVSTPIASTFAAGIAGGGGGGAKRGGEEQAKSEGLDPRCRITVVSSSTAAAQAFVDSVIALAGSITATTDTAPATPTTTTTAANKTPNDKSDDTTTSNNDKDNAPLIIPYTLTNRYYTAEVHFVVYTCVGFVEELGGAGGAASATPAVIVTGATSGRDTDEDDADIPVFKSEFESGGLDVGFRKDFEQGFSEEEEEDGGEDAIRRAPAVVYVWVDGEGYKKEVGEVVRGMRRVGYEPEVCLAVRVPVVGGGAVIAEEEDVDGTFMEFGFEYVDAREKSDGEEEDVGRLPRVVDALSTVMWVSMRSKLKDNVKGKGKGKDEERDEIMRELMDVVVSKADDSSVEMDMLSPFGRVGQLGRKVSMGFEDEFVPGTYRALGSVSDFGGSDGGDGYVELEEEEWEDGVEEVDGDGSWDEPTQEEIEETAGKIFGGFKKASEGFDLSSVLSSLESFKGEIAGMEDGEERKKMAARVALGLAYALDIE